MRGVPLSPRNIEVVLDSCPNGPGLSKIIEWTTILFGRTETREGRYSLTVILGVYYPGIYVFEALMEAFLPFLQVCLPS